MKPLSAAPRLAPYGDASSGTAARKKAEGAVAATDDDQIALEDGPPGPPHFFSRMRSGGRAA